VQRDMNELYGHHHEKKGEPGLKERLWSASPAGGAEE